MKRVIEADIGEGLVINARNLIFVRRQCTVGKFSLFLIGRAGTRHKRAAPAQLNRFIKQLLAEKVKDYY